MTLTQITRKLKLEATQTILPRTYFVHNKVKFILGDTVLAATEHPLDTHFVMKVVFEFFIRFKCLAEKRCSAFSIESDDAFNITNKEKISKVSTE